MKKLNSEQMQNVKGGMPCWAAKAAMVVAGITFVASAGSSAIFLSVLGLSFAEWGYLESCFPELLQS